MLSAPDQTYILPISKEDARTLLEDIRSDFHVIGAKSRAVMQKVRVFDQRAGWKVLDYPSLVDCLSAELGVVAQTGYRYLRAYIVTSNIRQFSDSPIGEIPEYHVRDTGIAELPPPDQALAYQTAEVIAHSEGRDKPTHNDVERGVALTESRNSVFQCPYRIVTQMVVTDKMTVTAGHAMVAALDKLKPRQQVYILGLMAKFELINADLAYPIAHMYDRKPGQESKVLPEVLTGFLGGKPLNKATLTDLERANYEARLEHLAEAAEARRLAGLDPLPKSMTLYGGDVARSLKVLRHEMGREFVYALMREIQKV